MTDVDETAIELDDLALEMLDIYEEATREYEAAAEHRRKARDLLLDFLEGHGARIGTVGGEPAVRATIAYRQAFDLERFKADEPALYDTYRKVPSVVRSIRSLRSKP